ncbi:MAG: diaminopimelate epimerase [Hyphomicrobiales bacterium]|nr:diaminopimelate epimerase [Hyphomicrobiales bacterium]
MNEPNSRHPLVGRQILRMNGLGNEILVLDLRDTAIRVAAADARAIGRAHGLHFDQLMVLYDASGDAAASMKIFNIDGSLAQSCGNGTRCVGWALLRNAPARTLKLESDGGLLDVTRDGDLSFTVDMGAPVLQWERIPLAGEGADTREIVLTPPVSGAPETFSAVGMGNPHAVFFVADAAAIDLAALGPKIEHHPLFPERVNASFAQMLSREKILLRVWERGAGATRACGTAACATAVAAARLGFAAREVAVTLPGGDLRIVWRDSDDHVLMTGPVEFEFERALTSDIFARADA